MTHVRKKHGWAFWSVVALLVVTLLVVAYPLSFGPVYRLVMQDRITARVLYLYEPAHVALDHSPEQVKSAYWAYCRWCAEDVMLNRWADN